MEEQVYYFDTLGIKQEPGLNDSAGMPIPNRNGDNMKPNNIVTNNMINMSDLDDFDVNFALNTNAQQQFGNFDLSQNPIGPSVFLSVYNDAFKMDADDILQVDENDLIQGPTLAELNANDDTLLGDLSFDDLLLPEDGGGGVGVNTNSNSGGSGSGGNGSQQQNIVYANTSMMNMGLSCSMPTSQGLFVGIPSPPTPLMHSPVSPQRPASSTSRHSTLHELLMRRGETENAAQLSPGSFNLLASVAGPSTSSASRLSSSAPTHLGLDQIWQRREPRQHLLSTGSLVEAGSTSSLSTGGVLSPASHELSHDEGFDSEDDSDHYDDFSSDGDSSDEEGDKKRSRSQRRQKRERFFWQYNVQAKGPKGQRLVLKTTMEDPHVLNEVTDPVFSPSCSVRGIKHSGKARKGDGNDLTPNPRKLQSIGRELDKLGKIINDMTPVSELPVTVRPKSRKEKNKLASRACRLKKKAQHEANKIKLYGLEQEHRRLISAIEQTKNILQTSFNSDSKQNREELARNVEKMRRLALKTDIAGRTTEFVNTILEKVKAGVSSGGLEHV